jgi:hypothetical protein
VSWTRCSASSALRSIRGTRRLIVRKESACLQSQG